MTWARGSRNAKFLPYTSAVHTVAAVINQGCLTFDLAVPCEVSDVPPGTLVPTEALTATHDVVKPRSLFGADEDWSKALLYH